LAAVLVPLSQESALLTQSGDNLTEWHRSLDRQYDYIIRILLFKTLSVIALIVIIWWFRGVAAGDLQVHRRCAPAPAVPADAADRHLFAHPAGGGHRLHQRFQLPGDLRRLHTAGVAVALQSVILSVAAYFFLIGRYGVKVGDRVTIPA